MSETRKRYSGDFKREAVRRMAACKTVTGLAAELGICRKFLYLWREQLAARGEAVLQHGLGRPPGKRVPSEPSPAESERVAGGSAGSGAADRRTGAAAGAEAAGD